MLRRALAISLLLLASPALADEQGQFLTKALASLQQQRNTAMDDAANAHAQAAVLRDQVAQQQAIIADMEAWIAAAKPKIPAEGSAPQ